MTNTTRNENTNDFSVLGYDRHGEPLGEGSRVERIGQDGMRLDPRVVGRVLGTMGNVGAADIDVVLFDGSSHAIVVLFDGSSHAIAVPNNELLIVADPPSRPSSDRELIWKGRASEIASKIAPVFQRQFEDAMAQSPTIRQWLPGLIHACRDVFEDAFVQGARFEHEYKETNEP